MAGESSIADKDDLGHSVGGIKSKIIGLGSAYLQHPGDSAFYRLCPSAWCHLGDDIHGSRRSK